MIKHDNNSELRIIGITAIIVIIICIVGSFGGLAYKKYFGLSNANIDRDIFKNSKSYIDGMISDLSEHKRELSETTDNSEKAAIINYIDEKFSNFDESLITNSSLRTFLEKVRSGELND